LYLNEHDLFIDYTENITFHFVFLYKSVICISYWAHWKVVMGSQHSTNTERLVFWHYLTRDTPQTFKWYGLKNMKLFEELRVAAAVSVYGQIRRSAINSSKSKYRLLETAGIGFQLARIGTGVRKDGPLNKCLSTQD